MPTAAALGRFADARRLAREHLERSQRLTAHHRVHSVALVDEAEELAGRWQTIRAFTPEVEQAVEANEATPCIREARSLFVCAAAQLADGQAAEAARLERAATDLGMAAPALLGPLIRLALLRRDLAETRRLLEQRVPADINWGLALRAARLDGLSAIRDRDAVEAEARPHLLSESYLEPFALRALAVVREDEGLLARALERFRALGLDWHAEQTGLLTRGP